MELIDSIFFNGGAIGIAIGIIVVLLIAFYRHYQNTKKENSTLNKNINKYPISDFNLIQHDKIEIKINLNIKDEIFSIRDKYLKFFNGWAGCNYCDIDFISDSFQMFCRQYSLPNNFKEEDNIELRFNSGTYFPEDEFEILKHPRISTHNLIPELLNLKETYYSGDDIDMLKFIISKTHSFHSFPIYDELNNFESKNSLRIYFHAIEMNFINYLNETIDSNKYFMDQLNSFVTSMKFQFGNLYILEDRLRDDLYCLLLNTTKMLDELTKINLEIEKCIETPCYHSFYRDDVLEVNNFEFMGKYESQIEGKYIDGTWYNSYRNRIDYIYYTFSMRCEDKKRLFLIHEQRHIKLAELILNCVTFFEIIVSDFKDNDNFNKYLLLRLDLDKQGFLFSHFEESVLTKIDNLNFSFIELQNILIRNNIELRENLEKLNKTMANFAPSLNFISNKIEESNKMLNDLNVTNSWNNILQIANLYYNYKTFKSVGVLKK